jgi:hypothetical protein
LDGVYAAIGKQFSHHIVAGNARTAERFHDSRVLEPLHGLQHAAHADDLTQGESPGRERFLRFDLVVKLQHLDVAEA